MSKLDKDVINALASCPIAELFARAHQKAGAYPSLGATPEELVMIALEIEESSNPIDTIRDRMMSELKKNWDVWRYRLSCDGNCYSHPDAMVIWCYIDSGTADLYKKKEE